MKTLNAAILGIPIPKRMAMLPISEKGFPTPWFVAVDPVTGERDFRVADADKKVAAVKRKLCWLCGQPLGVNMVFVIGPMCSVNRVSSEPPCHLDCADYSARACPFLSKPRMRRNEVDLPGDAVDAPGFGIKRNPGVTALWITKKYQVFRAPGGVLFEIGDPEEVRWFAEGRTAKRAEIDESIRTGLPFLEDLAKAEGPVAETALREQVAKAQAFLPAT